MPAVPYIEDADAAVLQDHVEDHDDALPPDLSGANRGRARVIRLKRHCKNNRCVCFAARRDSTAPDMDAQMGRPNGTAQAWSG